MIPLCLCNVISIVFCSCSDQVGAKRSHAFALARQWWRNTMLPDTKTCQYACVGIGIPGNLTTHAQWDFRSHLHYIRGCGPGCDRFLADTHVMTVVRGEGVVPGPTVLNCLVCTFDNWYSSWFTLCYSTLLSWYYNIFIYIWMYYIYLQVYSCWLHLILCLFLLPKFRRNKVK